VSEPDGKVIDLSDTDILRMTEFPLETIGAIGAVWQSGIFRSNTSLSSLLKTPELTSKVSFDAAPDTSLVFMELVHMMNLILIPESVQVVSLAEPSPSA